MMIRSQDGTPEFVRLKKRSDNCQRRKTKSKRSKKNSKGEIEEVSVKLVGIKLDSLDRMPTNGRVKCNEANAPSFVSGNLLERKSDKNKRGVQARDIKKELNHLRREISREKLAIIAKIPISRVRQRKAKTDACEAIVLFLYVTAAANNSVVDTKSAVLSVKATR